MPEKKPLIGIRISLSTETDLDIGALRFFMDGLGVETAAVFSLLLDPFSCLFGG
jgi:hypothetical protein